MLQATKILTKMAEHTRARLESDAVASEPEREVHACVEQRDLQEHLDNISSLRDLFVKQSQMLAMIHPDTPLYEHDKRGQHNCSSPCFDHNVDLISTVSSTTSMSGCKSLEGTVDEISERMEQSFAGFLKESSPTSVTTMGLLDQSSLHGFEKVLDFGDDDIDSTRFSLDGSDSDIQAAINEIRKEASQIDIIMALDQLKTVEIELEITTRALRDRSAEADQLRFQLEQREERVSCLELERDLYQADASKLRDDLKTCVDRMFDISAVAGTSTMLENLSEEAEVATTRDQAILRPATSPTNSAFPPIPSSTPIIDHTYAGRRRDTSRHPMPFHQHRGPLIQRLASASDPTTPTKFEARQSIVADAFPLLGSSYASSIFREPPTPSPNKIESFHSKSTRTPPLAPTRRRRSFSEGMRTPVRPELETEDANKDHRICGLFRRRPSKRAAAKAKDIIIMRCKIDQLHTMMRASLETSEKLRKRLALISRYYEGIIKKLQEQMVEIKTEKSRLRADMDARVSIIDHEKRIAVFHLESKLRQRDDEIRALKAIIAGTTPAL